MVTKRKHKIALHTRAVGSENVKAILRSKVQNNLYNKRSFVKTLPIYNFILFSYIRVVLNKHF